MFRKLLPVIVLLVLVAIGMLILRNPPQSARGGPPPARAMSVEVFAVQPSAYQVQLASFGTVAPRTRSVVVAQVGGQIIAVSDNLRDGGFFSKGDVLLSIDPRDFAANVQINQATVADAQQRIDEEQARAEQAARDWQRLGNDGEPNALVLRKPQLAAARARLESAQASLTRAQLDLERTEVRAPYDGRVLQQRVDIGQVVNAGTQIADIYATDLVEVRLPLRNSDLAFIDLPEGALEPGQLPDVEIYSDLGERTVWQGKVVRTEGAIDAAARQLHVVAQIDQPFVALDGRRPLKIGEYVTASISARQLVDAQVIPVQTIYQNSFLYVVEEGVLARREVEVIWQNEREAILRAAAMAEPARVAGSRPAGNYGLQFGDQVVTTPLGQVTSGLPVRVVGAPQVSGRGVAPALQSAPSAGGDAQ